VTGVTGAGPWPGQDALDAATTVLGELAAAPDEVVGMPFVPVLPDRGPAGGLTGRTLGLLVDLPAELGPHGWRLTSRPGRDLAAARRLTAGDVEALAVAAHGYAGPLVVPVLGPLSLATALALRGGDAVVADPAAVADLAASLAAGLGEHLAALARAVPAAVPTVLVHEPGAGAVLAGAVATFTGRGTLRSMPPGPARELLGVVVRGVRAAGATGVAVHVGTQLAALGPARAAGADGVGIDVAGLDEHAWERVAGAVEGGAALWAQVPVAAGPGAARAAADALVVPWRRIGLPLAGLGGVVLVGRSAADRTVAEARRTLATTVTAARLVAEV
jgi:hypothetical protein